MLLCRRPTVFGASLALGQRDRALAALKKYRELEPQNEWAVAELNRVLLEVLPRRMG
ncbi:MAG: hypothetical protein HY791_23145 [Deltaproteobacteria bacterium]|nr:hypothetical protein [Deltaproteobacteria bacterium]